jgi:hypothetical protein
MKREDERLGSVPVSESERAMAYVNKKKLNDTVNS